MPLPLLGALIGPVAKIVNSVIDRAVPDKGEAARLKAEAATAIHEQDMAELQAAVSVIVAEAQGGLQENLDGPGQAIQVDETLLCQRVQPVDDGLARGGAESATRRKGIDWPAHALSLIWIQRKPQG